MNEKEINLAIYNKLADIAREVFNHLTAEPGRVYTPADIARAITSKGLTWAEDYDPATVYEVAEGSFACSVNGWGIFHVLDRVARAWSIAAAARVKFITERAAAPVVASFTLTAAESRELLACCADDQLRPAMCNVHLDTRRRVLVAADGYIMRVVNLGDRLTITDTAAPYYNIHKSVIKAGRAVTITADNYAAAAGVSVACLADIYPNWAQVLNGCRSYSEAGRVALPPATWRELKKAVAYVAKVLHQSKNTPLRVTIAHTQGENVLHIYARDIEFERERETAVTIDPAAPSYSIDTDARRLAKVTTAAALYVADTCRPIITTDPAGLAMFMPLQPLEGDKYYKPFTIAPAGQTLDPLPGVDVAAAAADITAARETITAAPAADLTAESEAEATTAAPAADLTADTNEPTPADTITPAPAADLTAESEAETTAAAPAADLTAESEADTITAAERERLADTITTDEPTDDTDPEHARFAAGDVFLLLTDTGTTVPARVRSLYFNNFDDTAAPCWVYCYDCEPWINRHGQTIDGGSCDALRMTAPDTAAPAADSIESEGTDTPAEVAAPAALTAAAELLTLAEVCDAAKAIAKAKTADDYDSQRAARDARRLLTTAHGLTVTDYKIKTADGLTLARFIYTYGKKNRRTLCAPLLKVAAEFATLESLADEWAELTAAAADSIESEGTDTAAEVAAPAADLTADTNEPTPAETIESEGTDTPAEVAAPAADSEADTLPLLTIATADSQTADRAERRPLLLTVARYALRLAAAAALLLLLTIAPDRAADTLAAPAADSEADTITAAELLTADSEAESRAEVAAPADSPRPTAERRHAPANKRESNARALLTIATADSIAAPLLTIEADTLTADTLTAAAPAADSIESEGTDTPAEVATLEAAKKITDTPTDDTDSKADTITTDEPTDDTDPAAADNQTDSTPTDATTSGHPHAHGSTPAATAAPCSPSAPVAPIVIACFGI